MALDVTLHDEHNDRSFTIGPSGELIVGDYAYAETYFALVTSANSAVIVRGLQDHHFVLKSFWMTATKSVSASTAALITLYEAAVHDPDAILKTVAPVELLKNEKFTSPSPLNAMAGLGRSLVLSSDTAADINVTAVGYFIPNQANGS